MASPTKTFVSIILGIVVVYYLYYSTTQIVDASRGLENKGGPKSLWAAGLIECDIWLGTIGGGALLALYAIACLAIFLNKKEKPHFYKGQLICFILIGVFLALAFTSSAMAFVEQAVDTPFGNPDTIFIATMALSCFRLLLGGAIVGCGIHSLKHDHS